MVLGHEAPVTRVGAAVAVVAHHPVIVHLERIVVLRLAVDVDFAVLHLQVIALVCADGALVYGIVGRSKMECGSTFRNPYLAHVVALPVVGSVVGEHTP